MNIKKMADIKNIGKEKLILLGLAGIMLIGASYFESIKKNDEVETETAKSVSENDYQAQTEKKVEELIKSIEGVSKVSVMISYRSGSEKVLQEDSENSSSNRQDGSVSEQNSSVKKSTVLFQQNGNENPYVIKELYPEVNGIAVAAKGLSDSTKKEEVINMLAALFDIGVHKISIIDIN